MLPGAQDGLFCSREHAERFPGAQEEQSCSREHAERFPGAQEDRFCSREHAERLPRAQDGLFGSREVAERFPGAQDGRFCSREALHVGLYNRDHHIVGAFLHRQRIHRVLQPALPKGGTQTASAVDRHAGVNAVVS